MVICISHILFIILFIQELLPSNKSAIVITDFDSAESLAKYLKFLNENDAEYEKYLEWKKTGITNPLLLEHIRTRDWTVNDEDTMEYTGTNFIEGFECFLCNRLHENIKRAKNGQTVLRHQATVDHYGCPAPREFDDIGRYDKINQYWSYEFNSNKYYAKSLRYHVDNGITIDKKKLYDLALKFQSENDELR